MRISGIERFLGGADNVNAIDLIRGEQINYQGQITDPTTNNPIDITSYSISAVAELYNATVAITAGRGGTSTISVSSIAAPTPAIPDVTLNVTTTNAAMGQFRVTIPENLATDMQTQGIDATNVLIAAIYLTYNDGGTPATVRKSRIIAVIRHAA